MDRWPHMMRKTTAAAYCDLSEAAFLREVAAGRLPTGQMLGGRDHWFRPALDKALSLIAGDTTADYEAEFWTRGNEAA